MSGNRKRYHLKTIHNLIELFATLPDDSKERLVVDLHLLGDAWNKAGALERFAMRLAGFTWIDDDKGKVTLSVILRDGEAPIYTKEMGRWQ